MSDKNPAPKRAKDGNPDRLLSPWKNFRRTETLTCVRHPDNPILPAAVCPFCRWPEEIVTFPWEKKNDADSSSA